MRLNAGSETAKLNRQKTNIWRSGISAICQHCRRESPLISQTLGLCPDCIRKDFAEVFPLIEKAHSEARRPFNLPSQPPKAEGGLKCHLCANECHIPPNSRGYCGLRTNKENKLVGATKEKGNVSWYHDALPTNCVPIGSVPVAPGLAIPASPTPRNRNMATKTWLFSTKPAPSIAFSVRTGTIVAQRQVKAMSVLRSCLRPLMTALPVYVTLVVTQPLSCLTPFVPPGWL